jgi:hypothetical protein
MLEWLLVVESTESDWWLNRVDTTDLYTCSVASGTCYNSNWPPLSISVRVIMKYYYVVRCCCWEKGKGKLDGKKGDDYCQWTFAFCGWSLSRRETFVHSGELFPFPFYLSFHFSLLQHGRESVCYPPLAVYFTQFGWADYVLRNSQGR